MVHFVAQIDVILIQSTLCMCRLYRGRLRKVSSHLFGIKVCLFIVIVIFHLSRIVRKPAFCISENKDAEQLPGNREANQRLCFRYKDSTIPLLLKYEISSH